MANRYATDAMTRVFDGHNDILTRIYSRDAGREFIDGGGDAHLDLPRMLDAGFCGGVFAIMAPADRSARRVPIASPNHYQPVDQVFAQRFTMSVLASTFRLVRQSDALRIVRDTSELDGDGVGIVVHFEGAEAIDPQLNALEVFHAAGLRSLGLVWSRPNAFAEGVPFEFPASPDTGPGLTGAGRDLVEACNDFGIAVDLSHLNEKGFWDVAKLSRAPLVASHSNAHALCPSTRNLTDAQLDAIASSGGIAGVNFATGFLSPDGPKADGATPLSDVVRHFVYMAERMGVDHVGFGSDFDGAGIPDELGSVAGLPKLVEALSREFDDGDIGKLAHGNWFRVLTETWRPSVR